MYSKLFLKLLLFWCIFLRKQSVPISEFEHSWPKYIHQLSLKHQKPQFFYQKSKIPILWHIFGCDSIPSIEQDFPLMDFPYLLYMSVINSICVCLFEYVMWWIFPIWFSCQSSFLHVSVRLNMLMWWIFLIWFTCQSSFLYVSVCDFC